MKAIEGEPLAFFETGTEGVIWSVAEPGKSYEGLHELEDGDVLLIFSGDYDELLWVGVIDLDWEIGVRSSPLNPEYKQQVSNGLWCHGIQRGFEPDQWGQLFSPENKAVLYKTGKRK